MQRAGSLKEAARSFELAKALYPDNRAAEVNLECNAELAAGRAMSVDYSKSPESLLGVNRSVTQMLNDDGPVDEPSFCFGLGMVFRGLGYDRQSAQQLERLRAISPNCLPARVWLAELYNRLKLPDAALEQVRQIRAAPDFPTLSSDGRMDLEFFEAAAYLAKTDDARADRVLQNVVASHPDDNGTNVYRVASFYMSCNRQSNAIVVLDRWLVTHSNDVPALVTQGYLWILMGSSSTSMGFYSNAIPPLNRALSLQADNVQALFNRAIAYRCIADFESAKKDYEELLRLYPALNQPILGLGEIACDTKDTNAAVRYFQRYLSHSNSVPGSSEARHVQERLKELKARPR